MNFGLTGVISSKNLGGMYFVETGDGYYYVPKDCSASTNTIVYAHGAGGSNLDYYNDYLANNGIDAIFVVPKEHLSYYDVDVSTANINRDVHAIHESLGIANNNMETVAHSSGGQAAMHFMIENIKKNPEIDSQTCILIDPATASGGDASFIQNLTTEQLQIIGKNNSNIIGFEHTGSDLRNSLSNYQILASAGANVSVIGFSGMDHVFIARNAFNKGLLSYLAGNIPLKDVIRDSTTVYVYDRNLDYFREGTIDEVSGSFNIADILAHGSNFDPVGNYYSKVDFTDFKNKIANLKGLGNFESVSNDTNKVVKAMNDIRGLIKSTSLLSKSSNIGCQSTTSVPTCAENFLYEYQSDVLILLDKLANETEKAIDISNQMDKNDMEIANLASNLDDGSSAYL